MRAEITVGMGGHHSVEGKSLSNKGAVFASMPRHKMWQVDAAEKLDQILFCIFFVSQNGLFIHNEKKKLEQNCDNLHFCRTTTC